MTKRSAEQADLEVCEEVKYSVPHVFEEDYKFNVYVGSELGILKGVCFGADKPILKSFRNSDEKFKYSDVKNIVQLRWMDKEQKELLVGFKNQGVMVYNTKLQMFTQHDVLSLGEGSLVDLWKHEKGLLCGLESGKLFLHSFEEDKCILEISTGNHLSKIASSVDENIFATGGNENDLKIWNLAAKDAKIPTFKAKNVRHDFLDLRVPVWIQDLVFMPQTTDVVATCSRHGHVRLYDAKVNDNKNRPVVDLKFMDEACMAISATRNDKQYIVGSTKGKMALFDLRNYGKGNMVHMFRGFSGSIRSIDAHPELPYFVSCGLDMHLYLHHVDQPKPLKKIYLQSRLNSVIMTNDFNLGEDKSNSEVTSACDSPNSKAIWHNINDDVVPSGNLFAKKEKKTKTDV